MAPTSDEELKLRLFNGNLAQLRPADRFLKSLVDIPLAFKRLEALLFMGTIQEELAQTKEAFAVLEVEHHICTTPYSTFFSKILTLHIKFISYTLY